MKIKPTGGSDFNHDVDLQILKSVLVENHLQMQHLYSLQIELLPSRQHGPGWANTSSPNLFVVTVTLSVVVCDQFITTVLFTGFFF